jgi:glycerol-3-phosphate dehydrogenase subunit C
MSDPNHHPVELTLDQCIKCNICTTVCPVSAVTDLFPGPKYEAPQAGRFRRTDQPTPDGSVDYCSGCRVCNLACPTGVKIAEMNAKARANLVSQGKVPPLNRLRNNIIARAELVGKVAQPIAPIANLALQLKPLRFLMEKILRIHHSAPFPVFSQERFLPWFRSHHPPWKQTRQVVYFHGCSTLYYEPRVGRAAVRVLEANGFEVIIPASELLWPAITFERRVWSCPALPSKQRPSLATLRSPGGPHCWYFHQLHPYPKRRSPRASGYA